MRVCERGRCACVGGWCVCVQKGSVRVWERYAYSAPASIQSLEMC